MSRGEQSIEEILIACRAGRGHIIITEGATQGDDPWFYQQWFGARGAEVSFFAQNGWTRVREAVAELRAAYPHRAVDGIVDRDFVDDDTIERQRREAPTNGVWFTPRFTLENELLDPAGWAAVAGMLGRGPVSGWSDEGAAERVADAYRACLPVAAYNRTAHEVGARGLPAPRYVEHPNGAHHAAERLRAWGAKHGAAYDMGDAYGAHLAALESGTVALWTRRVTGKAVLGVLVEALNAALPKRNVPLEHLLSLYMQRRPEPSPELAALVDAIVDGGRRGKVG